MNFELMGRSEAELIGRGPTMETADMYITGRLVEEQGNMKKFRKHIRIGYIEISDPRRLLFSGTGTSLFFR